MNEEELVDYIKYKEGDKMVFWGISPITKTAHQLIEPKKVEEPKLVPKPTNKSTKKEKKLYEIYTKELEHYRRCIKKANEKDIEYITEYLIKLGYCNLERDGLIYHFTEYFDGDPRISMITKECPSCGDEVLLNIDAKSCQQCIQIGRVKNA